MSVGFSVCQNAQFRGAFFALKSFYFVQNAEKIKMKKM